MYWALLRAFPILSLLGVLVRSFRVWDVGVMVNCFQVEGLGLKDFRYKLDFIGRWGGISEL